MLRFDSSLASHSRDSIWRVRSVKRNRRRLKALPLVIAFIVVLIIAEPFGGAQTAGVALLAVDSSDGTAPELSAVLRTAAKSAFRSGWAGSAAGLCQVVAFMWLRCIMNHQYKHGGSFGATARQLYAEGGVRRFYRGLFPWALLQAPLSRFGDTAANAGALALTAAWLPSLPVSAATLMGSCAGACWRVLITPIDTCKTTLQTDGADGWRLLRAKVAKGGLKVLWSGWEGNWAANVVGHYPWFATVNLLSRCLPQVAGAWAGLLRNAAIGAAAATVSDCVSNVVRVVKTSKQTSPDPSTSYLQAARSVVAKDGLKGLFLRGLETRILTNILQGALFTALWRGLSRGA